MSIGPESCPGCIYSGHSHLETCPNRRYRPVPAADPLCGQPVREIKSDCVCTFECQCGECPHFKPAPDPTCTNADMEPFWDRVNKTAETVKEYPAWMRGRLANERPVDREPTCGICGVCESWHSRTGCDKWTPVHAPDPVCANADCGDVERLRDALRKLVEDVQDYEAWQRPCLALDNAKAALASTGKTLSEHHGPYRRCHADPTAAFTPKE